MLDDLKRSDPGVTEKELDQAGRKFFSKLAIEQQDSDAWWRIQRSNTQRGLLELERKKFLRESCESFEAWSANEKAKELAARGELPNTKLINELGKMIFGEDWDDPPAQETKDAKETNDAGAAPPPAATC